MDRTARSGSGRPRNHCGCSRTASEDSSSAKSLHHGGRGLDMNGGLFVDGQAADEAVLHVIEVAHRMQVRVEQLQFIGLGKFGKLLAAERAQLLAIHRQEATERALLAL